MSLDKWNMRNELLNEFQSAIECQTHGRLSHISLEVIDGTLIIEAHSDTFYTVQLALAAINTFTSEYPLLIPTMMSFRVDGFPLVLCNPRIQGTNGQVVRNGPFNDDASCVISLHHGNSLSPRVSPAVATATAS